MTEQRVQKLVGKFFRNECSAQEKEELARWITTSAHDVTLKNILENAWKEFQPKQQMSEVRADEILSSILSKKQEPEQEYELHEVPVRQLWFKKVAVAAIITLALGAGWYYFLFNHSPANTEIAKVVNERPLLLNDAYPGRTQATLTLSDGSSVVVDTSSDRTITIQGNTRVSSKKGELVYNTAADNSSTALFNSLNTLRGELFPLVLSDGTKVWLNAASSLRFPVAFNGVDRVVDLTGEAYFEVAKNPSRPFKVMLNGMEIEVLGTHFNINGYADEPLVKTTLIEGSLRVTKGNANVLLSRGQQAGLKANGEIELIKDADPLEAVSWKDGYFHFNKTSLENVMRQLSRWYDVDVEYENKQINENFSGDFRKDSNLSEALKILETSQVHCKIAGKKIIVLR